jgi:hypothetical protein
MDLGRVEQVVEGIFVGANWKSRYSRKSARLIAGSCNCAASPKIG